MKNTLTQPQIKSYKQHMAKNYRQTGAVLITGLVFLVVLTLLVLSIMRSATLEERMAGNARNRQIALQAAEAVISDAEENLLGETAVAISPIDPFTQAGFTNDCTNGFCSLDEGRWKSHDWDSTTKSRTFKAPSSGTALSLAGVSSPPRYYVEYVDILTATSGCPFITYRITARGVGPDSSVVVLQTNFRAVPEALDKSANQQLTC